MANKTSKSDTKRLPKGQRTHERRLKQAARKELNTNSPGSSSVQTVQKPTKQDQS